MRIASSMAPKRITGETGPKVSCRTSGMSGVDAVDDGRRVQRALSLVADEELCAAGATASFTFASNERAAASSMTVPMSSFGSIGSP